MFRSLLRMLKHIALAVIAIIALVCTVEVGLRGNLLYLRIYECESVDGPLTPAPCPITFQQLVPLSQVLRVSSESGEPVDIRTNSLSLRGPETTIPKPAGTYRIVCLGDDATFAPEIAEEATFPALLQAALVEQSNRPIEVINAGLLGHCPLLSLAWARQRLASLQPDLVILCCDGSDVADDKSVRPLARYAENGDLQSVCHPAAVTPVKSLMQAIEAEFELAAWLSDHIGSYLHNEQQDGVDADDWNIPLPDAGATDAIHIRQTWEPIAPLRDLCQQLAADFVVALIPSRDVAPISLTGTPDDVSRLLSEMTEEQGIPYLDVTSEFSPQVSPDLFLKDGGALSSRGHAAFAELLSWAIIHRDSGDERREDSETPITPAAAEMPTDDSTDTAHVEPSPLPSLGRRPRQDEVPAWSQ